MTEDREPLCAYQSGRLAAHGRGWGEGRGTPEFARGMRDEEAGSAIGAPIECPEERGWAVCAAHAAAARTWAARFAAWAVRS